MRGGDTRIGKLRDRIDVLCPIHVEDPSNGEISIQWQPFAADIAAEVRMSQIETERSNRLALVTRYTVTMRYLQALVGQTTYRLVVDGSQCEITSSIDPDRRRRWLVMTAVATD